MPPDITRLFKGPKNDFEVEVVFAGLGDESPKESHTFDEIIVVTAGSMELERSDQAATRDYKTPSYIVIPAGVDHQIRPHETPTKLVIIHPDRQE